MTLSEYSQLKHLVIATVTSRDRHSNLLQSLKDLFRDGINSVRRFEYIRSIEQLLQVLELRDLLSEDNVSPLKDIAKKVNSQTLLNKLNNYEANHEPREHSNYYASERANKSLSSGFINTTPIETSIGDKKKDRIFQILTERIGSSWRDLARSLKVQECIIDEIDDNYGTLATKTSIMLKHFDSRADRVKWHFDLCEALDKIRRKELRYSVQEIMMMNM